MDFEQSHTAVTSFWAGSAPQPCPSEAPRFVPSVCVPFLVPSLLLCNSRFNWLSFSCFIAIILHYGPPHQFILLLFGAFYVMWGKDCLQKYSLDFTWRHVCYITFFNPCVCHFLVASSSGTSHTFPILISWLPRLWVVIIPLDGLEGECRRLLQSLIHLFIVQKKLKWWKTW